MGQGTEPRDRSSENVEESERRESVDCREQILDPQVDVAEFDYSVENFFSAMDEIGDLCGASAKENFDAREIERFSSMVTFLKEWKYFYYDPKIINFTSEQVKDLPKDIRLPQFSAASVPKMTTLPEEAKQSSSNDFILHAGGLVWALDWCPCNQEQGQGKCEYLAVAAHPPTSAYHKIGAPLLGRGVIQIWCLLNCDEDIEMPLMRTQGWGRPGVKPTGKPRGRPRKKPVEEKPTTRRPRGRPRKRPVSSSDEEYTFTRPKEKLLGTLDQNGLKDLSLLNPLASPERSLVETSISETVTTTRKSRRGSKENILGTVDLGNKEEPPSISNGNVGTLDLVGYSCVDSRCTSSMNLHLSSSIMCTEQLMQPRRRGRPRKKPMLSASASAASCLASSGGTVCYSNEPGIVDGKELSVSCNSVIMTLDNSLFLTGPQANSLSLHDSSVPEKYNVTDTQPKRRGRPRKKLAFSVPKPTETSGDKHAHSDNSASLSLAASETEVTILPYLSRLESSMTVENLLSSSTEPHNKSADAQCKGETIQPKSRGRPRKRSFLKLDTFIPVKCTELTKDTDATCGAVNKYQEELNSILDIEQSGEENKKTEERFGFENLVLSDFCRDPKLPDDCVPSQTNHSENSMPLEKTISKEETVCAPTVQGLALPRVVFCLAHNGKVAWDVKWRPTTGNTISKECMGYLAVLLGNGSLEVRWEIPLPGMVKTLFTSQYEKGTDPRFFKLTPWFRCSTVKRGDRQSIPLSMEWSPAFPHDLILAGCHDGTVLVWKFSAQCSTQDARPLLCFVADSAPIRALAWAPEARCFVNWQLGLLLFEVTAIDSHAETENVFVTAGNEGLKFWDLRDPYRPLWELNPIQREILSLDWVKDPREWKYFYYDPKIINFTSEQVKDLHKDIRLPQF